MLYTVVLPAMCGPDIGVVVLCHVIVYIFALSFTHAYNFVINKFIKDFKACYVYMLYFILCYFIFYVMSNHMIASVKKEPQLSGNIIHGVFVLCLSSVIMYGDTGR